MDFKTFLENESRILYLMRGISGTGKSTLARKMAKELGGVIFSTDDYLEGKTKEEYEDNIRAAMAANKMHWFHRQNLERVVKAMEGGISPIFVDNTNVKKSHMQPYVEAAYIHNYEVKFAQPEQMDKLVELLRDKIKNLSRLQFAALKMGDRNIHGVPNQVIFKQLMQWHMDPKVDDFLD